MKSLFLNPWILLFGLLTSNAFSQITVINTDDSGIGSFRQAITDANATPGIDNIEFNIPNTDTNYVNIGGNETWTISPATDLPTIDESVIIDATTQPGSGNFKIILDGQSTLDRGLDFDTGGNEIYGLYLTGFNVGVDWFYLGGSSIFGAINKGNTIVSCSTGLTSSLADGHTIHGNYIGTDELGTLAIGNNIGISFPSGSNSHIIGGLNTGEGNVISGNTSTGVSMNVASNTQIEGNFIGTDPTGMTAIPNGTGISLGNSGSSQVLNNIISGNTGTGIVLNTSSNCTVQGNYIGVAYNGSTALGNDKGISSVGSTNVDDNLLGGLGAGEANIIANNSMYGIELTNANHDNNQIIGNTIHCNGKGIHLNGVGNDNKTPPAITSITATNISGTGTDGDAIHIYRDNSGCVPLQGVEYLGTESVTSGVWTLTGLDISLTDNISATATDPLGNTSEFSTGFGEIAVFQGENNGGIELTDGQVSVTDIGTGVHGQVFAIENVGDFPLNIASITVTGSDFEIVSAPTFIGRGATGSFVVRLTGASLGVATATVTITSDDVDESTFDFPVTGEFTNEPFVTTWQTDNTGPSDDDQITIPTFSSATYNYDIYWEEVGNVGNNGTEAGVTTQNHTITFPSAGHYSVEITGDFPRIYFNNVGDLNKILTIEQWGDISWSSMINAFYGCSNLTVPALDAPDLIGVASLFQMFRDATSFDQSINNWNVSTVTDISAMFSGASNFNQPLDNWVTTSVTDIKTIFKDATNFNQPINTWDVSHIEDMAGVFENATNFNQPLDNWNPSMATVMNLMFMNASSFDQPIDDWDVSKVTSMNYMLNGASSFDQNLGGWDIGQMTSATNMLWNSGMSTGNYDKTLVGWSTLDMEESQIPNGILSFGANSLTYCNGEAARQSLINTYGWTISNDSKECASASFITTWQTDNTGSSADDQITIPTFTGETYDYDIYWELVGDPTTSGTVTDQTGDITITFPAAGTYQVEITGIFPRIFFNGTGDGDKLLTIEQWGSITWTSMNAAFRGCNNLTLPAVDAPDLSQVTDLSEMFYFASLLNTDLNHWDVSTITNMHEMFFRADIFNGSIGSWNVINVTDMGSMFAWAEGFNQNISGWDVINVTDMSNMFFRCYVFDQDLSDWDVDNVITMQGTFQSAQSFDADIGGWNVSRVKTMKDMFNAAIIFKQDLSSWQVDSVTDMSGMFSASDINFDMKDWDVSKVTDMSDMFSDADFFNQDLNTWVTTELVYTYSMFEFTAAFNGDISTWDMSNVINMGSMFRNTDSFNQDLSDWEISTTNMRYMFHFASAFDQNLGDWDVSNVFNMQNMLNNNGMSTDNYDSTLIGWASLPSLISGVTLNASGQNYCEAVAARDVIISTYGWTITGDSPDCTEPTLQSTDITFDNFGNGQLDLSWTNGDGNHILVLVKEGAIIDSNPVDGTSYSDNPAFGLGSEIGTGNFVVYEGNGSSVTVTGLSDNTTYHFKVFTFNGSGGSENYMDVDATGNPSDLFFVSPQSEIEVFQGIDNTGTIISDGQATAIDFGNALLGNDTDISFAIENTGTLALNISSITSSISEYGISSIPTTIAAGSTEIFTITLSGATNGSFDGTITINNDDNDEGTFDFPVTGDITNLVSGVIVNDYNALEGLYNSADGDNWTDNTSWLTTNSVSTWYGASISDGGRVTGLDLSDNKLVGALDADVANLDGLISLDLSGNQLSDLPDLTSLTSLTTLAIEDNLLEFDDIEPNLGISGITYSPQGKIAGPGALVLDQGDNLDVTISVGGSQNVYQWVKNDEAIVGQTTDQLLIENLSLSDTGTYYLRITSTLATGLTLTSEDFFLTINTPEIQIFEGLGNMATAILDEQSTFVNFGSKLLSNDTTVTFSIANTGTSVLNISSITSSTGEFTIANAPTAVAVNDTLSFDITLNGSTLGAFNATITINNDDLDENPFTFSVTGEITAPEIQIFLGDDNNGSEIIDEQMEVINFQQIDIGNDSTVTFAIENTGTSALNITSINSSESQFTIDNVPNIVGANATETFNITLNGTSAGTFNATITVNNDDVNENPFTFSVSGEVVSQSIDISVTANASALSICTGEEVTLTGSGDGTTYTWDHGIADGVAFALDATTTYTVTGTDDDGNTNTDQITISVNELPTVSASVSETEICLGDAVTFTGSGATTYLWDNDISDNIEMELAESGTFSVIGTDDNGCINEAAIEVIVNSVEQPVISVVSDIGLITVLTSSSAIGNQWYDSGVIMPEETNQTISVKRTLFYGGNFTVEVTEGECSNVSEELINPILGIEDEVFSDISIWPNPVFDILHIKQNNTTTQPIQLFDLTGALIQEFKSNPLVEFEVNLSNLESGVYLLSIENSEEIIRFMKK